MPRGLGLGVLAWGPLGSGVLSGKYASPAPAISQRRLAEVDPGRLAIAQAIAEAADGLGLSSSVVTLAWLRAQGGIIPILGARTVQQVPRRVSLPAGPSVCDTVQGFLHFRGPCPEVNAMGWPSRERSPAHAPI